MTKNTQQACLSDETLSIVTRHHQYWLKGDVEGIMSLYHPEIRYFDYYNNSEITRDELPDYLTFTLLSPSHVILEHTDRIRVDGDTAFIQYKYSYTGANNKAYQYRSSEALTVKDGKIIRINEYSSVMRSQDELNSAQKGKIGLDDNRLQILLHDLHGYFESKQPYLNSSLNLAQVADATGYTRNQISYALNNGLQKSFYEYLNLARVEQLLVSLKPGFNGNITDAALQVGFNSTSTFYKFFKLHTGLTPKAYLKNLQV